MKELLLSFFSMVMITNLRVNATTIYFGGTDSSGNGFAGNFSYGGAPAFTPPDCNVDNVCVPAKYSLTTTGFSYAGTNIPLASESGQIVSIVPRDGTLASPLNITAGPVNLQFGALQNPGDFSTIPPDVQNGGAATFGAGAYGISADTSYKAVFVNGNVQVSSAAANGTAISAIFTIPFGLNASSAAQIGGFSAFNWVQYVIAAPNLPPLANPTAPPLKLPFVDPPPGGYQYETLPGEQLPDNYPYYLNQNEIPAPSATFVQMSDQAKDPHLTAGQDMEFLTALVGVLPGSTPSDPLFDLLYTFSWNSTYTGATGSVQQLSTSTFDDGSGTGGVNVTGLDIDPSTLPPDIQNLLIASGAQNVDNSDVPELATWASLGFGLSVLAAGRLGLRHVRAWLSASWAPFYSRLFSQYHFQHAPKNGV